MHISYAHKIYARIRSLLLLHDLNGPAVLDRDSDHEHGGANSGDQFCEWRDDDYRARDGVCTLAVLGVLFGIVRY